MKKTFLSLLTCLVIMVSCNQTRPYTLDQWKVGSSNDDMFIAMTSEDMQEMRNNGLDYLEVVWKYTRGNNDEQVISWAEGVRDRAKTENITIWSVHLPYGGVYDISQVNDTARQNAVEVNSRDMETASRILAPSYFIIHPSAEPIDDAERANRFQSSRQSLEVLARKAKELGAVLLVENLPRTCLGRNSTELLQIIEGIENTSVCFDVNHLLSEPQIDFIANCGDKIKSTHISDYDRVNERHWIPKKGVIDWSELLEGLIKTGYKGPFIYEVSQTKPPLTIKDLGDNWKTLKEEYRITKEAKK